MDPYGGENLTWNYRFNSVPGMQEMNMMIAGSDLKVWFNGKAIEKGNIRFLSEDSSGMRKYRVIFPEARKKVGLVAFSIKRKPGYQGTGVICEPVKIKTGKGFWCR